LQRFARSGRGQGCSMTDAPSVTGGAARPMTTGRRLPEWTRDPLIRSKALFGLSALGYALGAVVFVLVATHDGGYGYDSHAYWLAGRNVLEGQPLYFPHDEGVLGAYRYPPLVAQLWAPFTVMPALAFSWAWRTVCFLSIRYMAGSWRNVGLWLLVPLVWTELSVANVTFPVAAMSMMALRGRSWLATWAGVVKIVPLLLLPYIWLTRRAERRQLTFGLLSVGAACAVSFLLTPESWMQYMEALGWMSTSSTDSFGVVRIAPTGLLDALLRVAVGALLIAIAILRGSDRLAFTATIIAAPVLAIWRLAPLLALPQLGQRDDPSRPFSVGARRSITGGARKPDRA
jgi:hypothetical protein